MKLLVIDDDAKLADALARGLRSEGFTVDVATDGDDGLWMAREAEYDALIVDVMLPHRDGFQICDELRRADDWTPILMLTARDDELAETRSLGIGADDFMTKPYSLPVLVAHIRSIARRRQHCDTVATVVGDLRIDPVSRRVWSSGSEVTLTCREFDVLEFLMRRAGHVVTKEAILRGVWSFDFDGDENIVQVYVTRLRRKLDGPFGTRHISTVYGVGYRVGPSAA